MSNKIKFLIRERSCIVREILERIIYTTNQSENLLLVDK